jgi:uncharacterized protein YlxW (UPF0749 family)
MGMLGSQECLAGYAMQGLYCEECGKANGVFKIIAATVVSVVIFAAFAAWLSKTLHEDAENRMKKSFSQKLKDFKAQVQTRAKSLSALVANAISNFRSQFFTKV